MRRDDAPRPAPRRTARPRRRGTRRCRRRAATRCRPAEHFERERRPQRRRAASRRAGSSSACSARTRPSAAAEVQDRPLAAAVEAQPVGRRIEHPDERGDEAVVGERLGKLIVDLDECASRGRRRGGTPSAASPASASPTAPARCRVRWRRRAPPAALVEERQVEGVAAGELGGLERRRRRRSRARRHRAGSVLICTSRAISSSWRIFSPSISALGHPHALQRHRALRRQRRGERLVVGVERRRRAC